MPGARRVAQTGCLPGCRSTSLEGPAGGVGGADSSSTARFRPGPICGRAGLTLSRVLGAADRAVIASREPSEPSTLPRPTAATALAATATCTDRNDPRRRRGREMGTSRRSGGAERSSPVKARASAANFRQSSQPARCVRSRAISNCDSSPSSSTETHARTRSQRCVVNFNVPISSWTPEIPES